MVCADWTELLARMFWELSVLASTFRCLEWFTIYLEVFPVVCSNELETFSVIILQEVC